MKVIAKIQSKLPDSEPVDWKWYEGDSVAHALSSVATLLADARESDTHVQTLSVTVEL